MKCPVCGSPRVSPQAGLMSCIDCQHLWQDPLKVTKVYDADYIRERYDKYSTTEAMSFLRVGFLKAFARYGRLLDVGYGNGSFLKAAAKAGFDVYGSDVHGADYGIKDAPLEEYASQMWDIVTFFDSLEHMPDLRLAKAVASKARIVVVSIPCLPNGFPANKEWRHYRPGEHLHYFSCYSLKKFFGTHNRGWHSDAEDTIRGKLPDGQQNILTTAFIGEGCDDR